MYEDGRVNHTPETFGGTLRRWRDRLCPLDAGLPARPARRTRGLRREELADLAGVSVDYLVRLEQGRATAPSAQVVATLARALQLDGTERDYFYRLAGLLPPPDGQISAHVPPGVQRILARLRELPVGVFTADWHLISWSPLWAALLGDPGRVRAQDRNLIRATFRGDDDPARVALWPVRAQDGQHVMEQALVADLRHATAAYPDDRALAALISETHARSPRFADLWDTGAVGVHTSARKTVHHPSVGEVTVDCDVLTVPGTDIKLVVYSTAAGTPDAEKIEFLRVTAPVMDEARKPLSSR